MAVLLAGQNRPAAIAVAETATGQPAAQAIPAATTGQAAPAEKVVFTFENDEKMQEFETLWRQRQVAVVRMTVLQSYWTEEQALLTQLNEKLTSDYKVDTKKTYSLDPQRRVLIERGEAQPAPTGPTLGSAPAGPPASATP